MQGGTAEDDCVRRCQAYVEAGADIVMIQSPFTEEMMRRFSREIPRPILITIGSWQFNPSLEDLNDMGVKIVLYPAFIRQKTTPFLRKELRELLKAGKVNFTPEEREGKDILNNILGMPHFKEIQSKFKA